MDEFMSIDFWLSFSINDNKRFDLYVLKFWLNLKIKNDQHTVELQNGFIHQKMLKYVSCLSYNLLDWLLYECIFNVLQHF